MTQLQVASVKPETSNLRLFKDHALQAIAVTLYML